jgi:hypothetical protein
VGWQPVYSIGAVTREAPQARSLDPGEAPGSGSVRALAGPTLRTAVAAKVSNSVSGPVNAAISTSAATTGNLFRYAGSQYIFNRGTKGLTAGTYLLQINLGDGVPRTVTVGLR